MKNKNQPSSGVQEICRKLKLQLEELSVTHEPKPDEDQIRRVKLMEQLKQQLAELST